MQSSSAGAVTGAALALISDDNSHKQIVQCVPLQELQFLQQQIFSPGHFSLVWENMPFLF
ncbi:hypothetical protein FRX31_016335 [Thalictrum thalictroides]|uniref:Uncharacterized protein n=1 Tax=Thalictrum thalictroides TaxID=46969 RepID=A0A7J6W9H8_THATH|nr:hypothetical protein FRX31_016335 [Thalictrum thalictroides]